MTILIYGEDTYRMKEKLKEIVDKYKKVRTSGLNLKYYDGESFKDFQDGLKQASMFKEKKLAIVLNPFDNIEFKEGFPKGGLIESDDIIVIYHA